jgi:hypothetical protein
MTDLDAESPDDRIPGLADLRETTPPPSLVPAVMRRIAEPRPMTLWSWLRQSRRLELRASPLGLGAFAAAALALVVSVWPPHRQTESAAPPPVVLVRFTILAAGAHQVAVAGDFNGWDPARTPLADRSGSGSFSGDVSLPTGSHEYMFVVDGKWVTDPTAAELRPDGFGRTNAILRL